MPKKKPVVEEKPKPPVEMPAWLYFRLANCYYYLFSLYFIAILYL